MLAELFSEDELIDDRIIAGTDEAGRGPLAGPVVAAWRSPGRSCHGGTGPPSPGSFLPVP